MTALPSLNKRSFSDEDFAAGLDAVEVPQAPTASVQPSKSFSDEDFAREDATAVAANPYQHLPAQSLSDEDFLAQRQAAQQEVEADPAYRVARRALLIDDFNLVSEVHDKWNMPGWGLVFSNAPDEAKQQAIDFLQRSWGGLSGEKGSDEWEASERAQTVAAMLSASMGEGAEPRVHQWITSLAKEYRGERGTAARKDLSFTIGEELTKGAVGAGTSLVYASAEAMGRLLNYATGDSDPLMMAELVHGALAAQRPPTTANPKAAAIGQGIAQAFAMMLTGPYGITLAGYQASADHMANSRMEAALAQRRSALCRV
jgi:hypothetical protein